MDSDKILGLLNSCADETCEGCEFENENNCMARLMSMAKVEIIRLRNENAQLNADLADAIERLLELTHQISGYMAAVDEYLEKERERN